MSEVYIYGLKDPRTGEIRYVGKTVNPSSRFSFHMAGNDVNRHKQNWLTGLKREGVKPEMVILEVTDEDRWEGREKYWIAKGRKDGWPLTNIAEGGANNSYSASNFDSALEPYLYKKKRLLLSGMTEAEKLDIVTEATKASIPYAKTPQGFEIARRIINERIG